MTETRCGFVALIGEPNAGKSTLLNRMVGAKVSIVTHKVQTTRARVRGIAVEGTSQIVFVDTPGIFRPRRRLDRAMVQAAWSGADDADVACLVVSDDGVEKLLVTARTRTTNNDIRIREFKTITGVVSFLIGIGFAHADVPLVEGQATSHKLAVSDEGDSN